MAKIKTADLIGPALNWAVGIANGDKEPNLTGGYDGIGNYCEPSAPSTNPAQGQPILERERISLRVSTMSGTNWAAFYDVPGVYHAQHRQLGPTMLTADLRCFVAKYLGNEVEVPDELLA